MWKLKPVSLQNVELTGGILARRARINREDTLSGQYRKLEESGRLDQVRKAAGEEIEVEGHVFWDSDIAKWIEAVGYSLAAHPNPDIEEKADAIIELYERAQEDDGYLNTYFSVFKPEAKWSNLRDEHELYCVGHLIEAAVAYYVGTGKRKLIDIMSRAADHIDSKFGPEEEGKLPGYPGHQELELALVKLYEVTGEDRYLNLAGFMVDQRGTQPHYFKQEAERRDDPHRGGVEYWQAHKPAREQEEAVGHAVRAMYLYCGMADVAAYKGDSELFQTCKQLWESATERKMYITGAVGSRRAGEAFGDDYELPNATAYAETCAAIGLVFFAHRMLQIEGNAHYADILEQALFNGVFSGLSVDGKSYFYVNPLSYDGKRAFNHGSNQRKEWFGCACCPPNLARLLPSLGQYMYSTGEGGVYVHLYAESRASVDVGDTQMTLTQKTNYPWDGQIEVSVQTSGQVKAPLCLRLPEWCSDFELAVNGESVEPECREGYLVLDRDWTGDDKISLNFHMPVMQVTADPRIEAARGCVALQRGPIVYCVEQVDNETPVSSLALSKNAELTSRYSEELLGGCCVIEGRAEAVEYPEAEGLYVRDSKVGGESTDLRAIPYALWANRGNHAMMVWLQRQKG